jgi:copper chaperone CopZ
MKNNIAVLMIAVFFACNQSHQNLKTEKFKVYGNCGMCKKTIEASLKNDQGIVKADWNVKSKLMTVEFDSLATSLESMQKAIASVGYDNERFTGDELAYASLAECCQYKRKEGNTSE